MRRLIDNLDNASWKFLAALQTAIFVLFHALALALGLRFDMAPLGMFAHYADPVLLRTRLLESVFYLHVQPPLYNLALGAILKLFPGHEAPVFHALFLLNGLALYVLVLVLQTRLGVRKSVALATSTLFVLSPTFLVFEHVLVYTLQCATLLVAAALLLETYLRTRVSSRGWAFFISLFLLCGIRSMYHLGYYVLIACAVAAVMRGYRRQVLWMALIPGVILFSFYAKNYVLFDKFPSFLSSEKARGSKPSATCRGTNASVSQTKARSRRCRWSSGSMRSNITRRTYATSPATKTSPCCDKPPNQPARSTTTTSPRSPCPIFT
ncbi:MAG: hypothetical protein NTZ09_07310 [Candidatus Hydrogenedentes bacterium]|nr:hypothetical protein [Candidatus Hydrogenedentota bacterium]